MNTVRRNVGLRSVSIVLVLLFMGALAAPSEPAHAQTWAKLYHGPWGDWWTGTTFYGTLPTSDGGYLLTGTSNNFGVILKVSNDGTPEWSKLIKENGYQKGTSMIGAVETSDGDFIVTGAAHTDAAIYPEAGAGSWDIYIIRLTTTGDKIWEKFYARKNQGSVPDTNEYPQYVYKDCPEAGGACKYVVTGFVIYSGTPSCPYSGYRASQTLVVDDDGDVLDDFLMGGPAATGDGAIKTVYTSDRNYLVLNNQANPVAGYTMGLQKYGPTGSLIWTKAYYEAYHQVDGDHLRGIEDGAVTETDDGYVLAGDSYDSVTQVPPLGAYYHFMVDKATGAVAWNKKYRVWKDWNSLWVASIAPTPDGGLLAKIEDGATPENDRIFKTSQENGSRLWVNEYGANLGTVTPGIGDLTVARSSFDALLANLSIDGQMDDSCKALPISDKTSEAVDHAILRTDVFEGFGPSGCNSQVGRVTAYDADRIEAGEYRQTNVCAPRGEVTADWNGDFGPVNIGSPGTDRKVYLSNYNGLSNLNVRKVLLSNTTDFSIVPESDSCSGKTLYPVNVGEPTSCAVTVRLSPVAYGAKKCTATFASNNDTPLKQALKGTGVGGAVRVTITPSAALTAGARWRVDGKTWQKSGAKAFLPAGSHVISYKKVAGWKKPTSKTVDVVNDQTLGVKGVYKKISVE